MSKTALVGIGIVLAVTIGGPDLGGRWRGGATPEVRALPRGTDRSLVEAALAKKHDRRRALGSTGARSADPHGEGRWFEDVTHKAGIFHKHTNRTFKNPYAQIMQG